MITSSRFHYSKFHNSTFYNLLYYFLDSNIITSQTPESKEFSNNTEKDKNIMKHLQIYSETVSCFENVISETCENFTSEIAIPSQAKPVTYEYLSHETCDPPPVFTPKKVIRENNYKEDVFNIYEKVYI